MFLQPKSLRWVRSRGCSFATCPGKMKDPPPKVCRNPSGGGPFIFPGHAAKEQPSPKGRQNHPRLPGRSPEVGEDEECQAQEWAHTHHHRLERSAGGLGGGGARWVARVARVVGVGPRGGGVGGLGGLGQGDRSAAVCCWWTRFFQALK